jgi:HEAT repeat protein
MPRSSKPSNSQNKSSEKKHTAVPPKGGVAEAPQPSIAEAKKQPFVAKTVTVSVSEPAAKQVEAPKVAVHTAVVPAAKPATTTGPSDAIQALVKELESNCGTARQTAATEIGRSGDRHGVPALIAALRDGDADVAREAATALGILGDRSAVDALVEVLADTNGYYHAVVRAAAASSLGQLKDTRAVEALLVALTDPIAEPSVEAIRALAELNDRRAISALIDVVRNRSGFFVATVRRAAVLALVHFGGPEAIEQLRFVASDEWEDGVIRDEAQAAVNKANA